MKRFGLLGVALLAMGLMVAGGCAKKVSSTPAGASGSVSTDAGNQGGLTDAERQRMMAIEKIQANRIYFAFDSNELSQESRQILTEKAELMKANPSLILVIEGHCDERGTNEYNMALGERRARAAKDFLALSGVDASRIQTISYGEERPMCTEHNEACWSKNRRDEFRAQ
ncbi:MAG: peptidoglycan-associated lipoprotein [Desulfomicrobiaceae bacterium]|jgi:peptidoglycan-associated lipoprotein|nr:peptidoglycan-associated lipoprotein Pal [Desulfomicrobiaceae bacterium]MDI3493522.1 peptidoglycan-associated lipoprotein [Desulfomicrobiaceae bacterium]MDK2874034.1 peptidoglycan-associated lipoprotein [Desulfomicrobiaceae bacterium]